MLSNIHALDAVAPNIFNSVDPDVWVVICAVLAAAAVTAAVLLIRRKVRKKKEENGENK